MVGTFDSRNHKVRGQPSVVTSGEFSQSLCAGGLRMLQVMYQRSALDTLSFPSEAECLGIVRPLLAIEASISEAQALVQAIYRRDTGQAHANRIGEALHSGVKFNGIYIGRQIGAFFRAHRSRALETELGF